MEHMELYNSWRQVPKEAQKAITGGRLNGMTDINPMWRIQCLTERFGPCGMGWKYIIITLFVIFGTFVFSAIIAQIVLKTTGVI